MQLFRPSYCVDEILKELKPVLESGWCGPGPKCAEFEKNFNNFIGSKHCHYMNSATSALHIALKLADIPKGSYVLTTPLTFISTNAVILYEGMIPVFVDVNEFDLSLDSEDFLNKYERYKPKAALWVHYGGNASNLFDHIMIELGRKKDCTMIEDCAHAMGGFYDYEKRIGSRTDTISCFSYQAVKNLPTMDSGMVVIPNEEMLIKAKKLAWMGIDKDTFARTNSSLNEVYKWKYDVPMLGYKYNGNDIAATIANVQLRYLDRDNAYRKQIYRWYSDAFCNQEEKVKLVYQCESSSHHLVVIQVKNRDEVIQKLKDNGIAPGVHYLPNYEFPILKEYYESGSCPTCERVSKEIISLPNHLLLTKQDIDKVCEVVIDAARA